VPAPVREEQVPAQHPFIPPAAEAPTAARMPRVEDFPAVAQREIQAQRAEPQPQHEEDRGPMGMLRRLAANLGRREEEAPQPQAQRQQPAPQPRAPQQPQAPQPRPQQQAAAPRAPQPPMAPRAPQPSQDSMYRPRQAELDQHGRVMPRSEDDQLEIPAFLRRQAN
jgi:cell division protein FtsZ